MADPTTQAPRLTPAAELIRQIAFVGAAVLLYFGVRGLTQGDVEVAVRNGFEILAFERRLGLDLEHWAQGLIINRPRLMTLANWVYIWGHWPVIAATLVWLHRTRRDRFLILRNAMFLSGAIGLVIFATYAVAPPRLLDVGLSDTVTQHSTSYRLLQPPALVNKYAAVPSLHVGWNLLVGIALFRSTRWWPLRLFAVLSPMLMAVAVVVTANHYVIDGILGSALALVGLAASVVVTPQLTEIDARLRRLRSDRQDRQQLGIVDDEPIDAPTAQPAGRGQVRHRPGEDTAMPLLEMRQAGLGQQATMDHHPVKGRC
jgi:hypothetical protein